MNEETKAAAAEAAEIAAWDAYMEMKQVLGEAAVDAAVVAWARAAAEAWEARAAAARAALKAINNAKVDE